MKANPKTYKMSRRNLAAEATRGEGIVSYEIEGASSVGWESRRLSRAGRTRD